MMTIEAKLLAFFQRYPNKTIVVAYSGGVDSQVLLAALSTLKKQQALTNPIRVCHVNHGLSENAAQWQQFAVQQCQHFQLPLSVHQLNLVKQAQTSLEALARDGRYQVLANCLEQPALVVTGHHLNDQAETLLLALKRGAGLKGLSSMAIESTLQQHRLVRPLLSTTRADIVNYAKQQNLLWIEDESNQDQCFDRNFIRHSVMPVLENRWPSIVSTISRSAKNCQDAQALLDEVAADDLKTCQVTSTSLSVPKLLQLSTLRFNNLLRCFLSHHDKLMPSVAQLKQVSRQLHAAGDKNPAIKVADYTLRRYQSRLYLTPVYESVQHWQQRIAINELTAAENKLTIALPNDLGSIVVQSSKQSGEQDCEFSRTTELRAPTASEQLSIRFSHDNPKCQPSFRDKSRSLKKIIQEAHIPTWQRQRLPLIYYNEVLVAVMGVFSCKYHLPSPNQPTIKLVWLDAG